MNTRTATEMPPEAQLRDPEQQIAAAVLERDLAAMDRIYAEDFIYTGPRGEVRAKADVLGDLHFDVLRFDDLRIRVYGEAALVTGLATTKGRGPLGDRLHCAQATGGEFRYTRVYARRDGRWQIVAFQATPIVGG